MFNEYRTKRQFNKFVTKEKIHRNHAENFALYQIETSSYGNSYSGTFYDTLEDVIYDALEIYKEYVEKTTKPCYLYCKNFTNNETWDIDELLTNKKRSKIENIHHFLTSFENIRDTLLILIAILLYLKIIFTY